MNTILSSPKDNERAEKEGTERSPRHAYLLDFLNCLAVPPRDGRHVSVNGFVLEHGRFWTGAPLPSSFIRMPKKLCFFNTYELMRRNPTLIYVEGYGYNPKFWPIGHAWCVDQAGRVVDPTWDYPQHRLYFGVALRRDYVLERYRPAYCHAVIDDYEEGFPIFRAPVEAWKL